MPGERPPLIEGRTSITEQPDTLEARAISLNQEADRVLGPQTFDDLMRQREADLRDWLAKIVIPTFVKANGLTLAIVGVLALLDEINVFLAPGSGRIITSQVIMALLGATTVQVGSIAYLIARHLFHGRPS